MSAVLKLDQKRLDRLRPLTLREMNDLAPPRWRINELLPREGLVVLFGAPKTLKSFVAIDWALNVATGRPWLGHAVEQCDVVYVAAEGIGGFGRRTSAWLSARNLTLDDAQRFYGVRCPVDMTEGGDVDYLIHAVRATGLHPGLIVLDTVSRCFGGKDTYQQQDMSRFVASCDLLRDEFNATIIAVHHCAKARGKKVAASPLGSVALQGGADALFLTERDEKSPQLTLRNTAQKEADEYRDIHLFLTPEGDSCVLWPDREAGGAEEKGGNAKPEERSRERRLAILDVLERAGEAGISFTEWLFASGLGSNKKAFNDIRKVLVDSGDVRHDPASGRYFLVALGETTGEAAE
jgi:hypothetical protein